MMPSTVDVFVTLLVVFLLIEAVRTLWRGK